jgi:pimeloyl-ACP methyl ester carboxylesterase
MRVIFLPGAAGDGAFWSPLARLLPRDWATTALDWPGLGAVPPSPEVNGFDDLVRLTLRALDGPADLVAQSMGGVVALRVALERPDLVRRLVLVATSGGIDVMGLGAADWRPSYAREYPHARRFIVEQRPDLTGRLAEVRAPALLVWGDADTISPLAVGRRLASVLPRAELVVIPGGDHALARDRAAEVAPHVRRHFA